MYRPGVFRVLDSQNGGVNPSYTSYDEIWTWIPVVRGNEDTCQPRQETSRNITISPAATSLASNLEPPPYSVAISTPARHNAPSHFSSVTSVSTASPAVYGNTVSSISTITSVPNIHPGSFGNQNRPQSSVPGNRQSILDGGGREVVARSQRSAPCHMVTSTPIQSPRVSHRQQPIREVYSGNGRSTNQNHPTTFHGQCDVRSPLPNRRSYHEDGGFAVTRSQESRNGGNTRTVTTRPTSFTYDPDEGVYSYRAGNMGRRIWCDIPPSLMDEDGPPPYTRQTNIASQEYYQRRPLTDRPAPIVRYTSMSQDVVSEYVMPYDDFSMFLVSLLCEHAMSCFPFSNIRFCFYCFRYSNTCWQ